MPFPYQFEHPPMVYMVGWGPPDRHAWLESMRLLLSEPGFARGVPLLLDVRDLDSPPAAGLGEVLADDVRRLLEGHRLAVVASGATYTVARQVSSMVGEDRVQAFPRVGDARRWLMDKREP